MLGSSSHTNLIVSIMSMPLSCLSAPLPTCSGHVNVTTSVEPAGERNTKSFTCGVAILLRRCVVVHVRACVRVKDVEKSNAMHTLITHSHHWLTLSHTHTYAQHSRSLLLLLLLSCSDDNISRQCTFVIFFFLAAFCT